MKVQLLGVEISFPICVAPTGGHCILHWEGETATARGNTLLHQILKQLNSFSTYSMFEDEHMYGFELIFQHQH